jgi:hypothetical protein
VSVRAGGRIWPEPLKYIAVARVFRSAVDGGKDVRYCFSGRQSSDVR